MLGAANFSFRREFFTLLLLPLALFVGGFFSSQLAAQELPAKSRAEVQKFLRAGEFGPALALARRTEDRAERDALLADIVRAQRRFGAGGGAVSTARGISSDVARGGALGDGALAGALNGGGFYGAPGGAALGGRGGGVAADFQPLIDLIQNTTGRPEDWADIGGGDGTVEQFQGGGGVYVDTAGVLRKLKIEDGARSLASLRHSAARVSGNTDVRKRSVLRKVSLTRLERELQLLHARGKRPDEAMKALAGLREVQFVFVYRETGDIVLAGPAGDWTVNPEGRRVSKDTHRPVLNLDDLVVLLQNSYLEGGKFGCSIDPQKENLTGAKAFLTETASKPFTSDFQRQQWMRRLRDHLGKQDITVFGVDPRTRVGWVIVEADYHMKLVGMGLTEGVLGVTSYLDMLTGHEDDGSPMDVLRWWFTLNYDAIQTTKDRNAFALRGQAAKVLSENELLTEKGERLHTGKSDFLNSEYARNFTKHFKQLAAKYPIYQELKNVFDLALVASLIRSEDLPGRVDWHLTHFLPHSVLGQEDSGAYRFELYPTPRFTETIVNHRSVSKKGGKSRRIVIGVSGGVKVDPSQFIRRDAIKVDEYDVLKGARTGSTPKRLPPTAWWWD